MLRTLAIVVVAALVVAACSSPGASPMPPASAGPLPTPLPTLSAPPTPEPSPVAAGPWVSAGTMPIGLAAPRALLVGAGRVLVVGINEVGVDCIDSATVETWDPSSNAWSPGPRLLQLREEFAAVSLVTGDALITGGVNDNGSLSGTDVYRAYRDPARWTQSGDLGTARVAPAAAVLPDGRVLVAGGMYAAGGEALADPASGATLAAYHPQPSSAPPSPLDDAVAPEPVPALATAELYDPATGAWSATGPLRYARLGAAAATLADGRVLIVGSRMGSAAGRPSLPDRAFTTAEIYDPATGTFSLAGDLPAIDWSPIANLDPVEPGPGTASDWPSRMQVVALADGGAIVFDRAVEWYGKDDMEGRIVRTLRFDPAAGSWTVVDVRVWQHKATGDPPAPMVEVVAGRSRSEPLVARLADGRILVAGGIDGTTGEPSAEADLYDPAANSWTTLPAMPEARAGGAGVALPDGSVLLVGGHGTSEGCPVGDAECECGEGTTGLASAVRFVPGP